MTKLATAQTAPEYLAHFVAWFYKEHGHTPKTVDELRKYLKKREDDYNESTDLL